MNINIKKIFQRRHEFFDSEGASHEFMRPARDWRYIFLCSVLVCIAGATYSAFDFYIQFAETQVNEIKEERQIRYKDKEVVMVANSYKEKEARFLTLRTQKPPVPEMSVIESASSTPAILEEASIVDVPLADTPVGEYTEGAPTPSP